MLKGIDDGIVSPVQGVLCERHQAVKIVTETGILVFRVTYKILPKVMFPVMLVCLTDIVVNIAVLDVRLLEIDCVVA